MELIFHGGAKRPINPRSTVIIHASRKRRRAVVWYLLYTDNSLELVPERENRTESYTQLGEREEERERDTSSRERETFYRIFGTDSRNSIDDAELAFIRLLYRPYIRVYGKDDNANWSVWFDEYFE